MTEALMASFAYFNVENFISFHYFPIAALALQLVYDEDDLSPAVNTPLNKLINVIDTYGFDTWWGLGGLRSVLSGRPSCWRHYF